MLLEKDNPKHFYREEAKARMRELLKPSPKEPPQIRLERIWTLLRMSDTEKLDMAIKYSTDEHVANLVPVRIFIKNKNLLFKLVEFKFKRLLKNGKKQLN
jgi:hypothetical protein